MATKNKPEWAKWKNRPEWAKPLNARLWEHLAEDAFNPGVRPTLAGVKRNRASQLRHGVTCHDCRAVAVSLGLED